MTRDNIIAILTAIIPTLILIIGGQLILVRYRKRQEQEVELLRSVREQRYKAVESLYDLFAQFMALYREIDNSDLKNEKIRNDLLKRAIEAESQVDALIVRIACEFVHGLQMN